MRAIIIFLFVVFVLCCVAYFFPNTPPIILPKGAQHNTLGELPFIEVMDDGDFYEVDGAEGDEPGISASNCNYKINKQCEHECNKKFFKKTMCQAECYLSKVYFCDDLFDNELQAHAAAGNFTAEWLVFMSKKCGGSACNGNFNEMYKYNEEFKEIKNVEWGDKMKWLGNQGNFSRGLMK